MSRTLEILERLIAFPSVSSKSNLPIIDFVEDLLTASGFAVHRIPDESGKKAGIFAAIGPKGPGGVMLSGHTDVVPVAGQDWSSDPFSLHRDGERVYGRGTADMKGFLACTLAAAERAAALSLSEPLKIAFSYDEEIGCVGIPQMLPALENTIGKPRLCIVGEPTSMRIAVGHKGKAALRATCHGTNGHSAMAPDFLNALHLAADFIVELRRLQDELADSGARDEDYDIPYSTVHVGRLSGGTALNIVPQSAKLDFEFRHLAADDAGGILDRIREAADRAVAPHRQRFSEAAITIEQINAYPGLETAASSEAVGFMQMLLGSRETTKVAFGTEAGYFDRLGIPTVVCGPGSMEQGHKPDEFIGIDQLSACDGMLDKMLSDIGR